MKVRTSTCTYSSIQLFCKNSSKSSQIRPFNFAPYQINKSCSVGTNSYGTGYTSRDWC